MSREVIQDFLNLPGVVGIALANRRMRPYFYGLDSVMERTKEVLGQGILQVMENVPDGFEAFEFHFAKSIVFVYKLSHGLVLLVMADRQLNLVEYRHGIKGIKHLVETDTYNTVATFKLLLGSVTQHSLPSPDISGFNTLGVNGTRSASGNAASSQPRPADRHDSNSQRRDVGNQTRSALTGGNRLIPPSEIPHLSANQTSANQTSGNRTSANQTNSTRTNSTNANTSSNTNRVSPTNPSQTNNQINSKQTNQTQPTSAAYQRIPPASNAAPVAQPVAVTPQITTASLGEIIQAMNQLSQFTTQYLGKVVVANYWKSTRPDHEWLSKIEVDRNAALSHPQQGTIQCNGSQRELMHQWLEAYIKRCKQVIRNFDTMICQDCLDEAQQKLLLL